MIVEAAALLMAVVSIAAAVVALRESLRARREVRELTHCTASALKKFLVVSRALTIALKYAKLEKVVKEVKRKRRRRYVAFYVVVEGGGRVDPGSVEREVIEALKLLGGLRALAEARPRLVYYDTRLNAGIIGFNHRSKYLVLAALGLVRAIDGRRAILIPVRTSGTVRKAKKALGLKS